MTESIRRAVMPAAVIRRLCASWLCEAAVEYILLEAALRELDALNGLSEMSVVRVFVITAAFFVVLQTAAFFADTKIAERLLMLAGFAVLSTAALTASFTLPFLIVCLLILAVLTVYLIKGSNTSAPSTAVYSESPRYKIITAVLAASLFLFISIWTVCRVVSFSTPTYDFGIFAQMYESMRKTGVPVTTVERELTMSHFNVHVSPIYYLLLPFYIIVPRPETLQVLQAAVIASSVIPLWLLSKHHRLSPLSRTLICALLIFYPALSGGASYDIHENCFLTPLILWLLYGIDKMSIPIISVSAVLTLLVKEDAAVYVAVAALWLTVKTLTGSAERKKGLIVGAAMLCVSVGYFFLTTAYLANVGDGVMTSRYKNFMYDGSDSLITVIKAVIICPMKAVFECVDSEKLTFILQTMLPLLGLPLITRRYHRFILLIPYVLLNLMSDYVYQHDIFFQYTFGPLAFLFYLTAVNIADLKLSKPKPIILASAVLVSAISFSALILPKGMRYPRYYFEHKAYFTTLSETLNTIPDGASVAATGYYTTHLADHELLYDVFYATRDQLLSCEYIALDPGLINDYRNYRHGGKSGYEALIAILEENGYELYNCTKNMVIYRKEN